MSASESATFLNEVGDAEVRALAMLALALAEMPSAFDDTSRGPRLHGMIVNSFERRLVAGYLENYASTPGGRAAVERLEATTS